MSILAVGSIALDWVRTPAGSLKDALGGSVTYFSYAASFFSPVRLVGVVGEDFPKEHVSLLTSRKINLDGLEVRPGKTFRWKGSYVKDLNQAETCHTHLNVFADFSPKIPTAHKDSPYVFLANIEPRLQLEVLSQVHKPVVTACDTMNLWITTQKPLLLKLLKKVDILILNDGEAKMLTKKDTLIAAGKDILSRGPKVCVIKKGEHGSLVFTKQEIFVFPAYPVETVVDPTGAGDTFAGGFFGYLAKSGGSLDPETLKIAALYGTVMASFNVQDFSLKKLTKIGSKHITDRFSHFKKITHIG